MAGIANIRARHSPSSLPLAPRARSSLSIDLSHVRALLWLRWKLTVRGYTRSWRKVVGLVFTLLFLLWFAGAAGVTTGIAYQVFPRQAAMEVLFSVVTALYGVWAILPLLQYNLNEGLDVTKLQTYPLTRGEQMVSLVLATFFDISTVFILALYVAIFLGWHATPVAAVITIVALAFAYLHTVSFSQLVLAALMGILRSRRYRDLAVIVFAIAASFWSLGSQVLFGRVFRRLSFAHPESLGAIHVDRYLQWSPPGMAARAITLADSGHIAQALPWLIASGALVPLVLSLWARILERGITTAESAGAGRASKSTRRRKVAASQAAAVVATSVERSSSAQGLVAASAASHTYNSARALSAPRPARRRRFSGPARAIAWKDALYVWRDPQLKAALLSSLLATAFLFVPNLFSASETGLNGRQSVVIAPVPALLVIMVLSINALGLERQGLQTLFIFPVRPLDILFGKNLFAGGLAFLLEVILTVLKAALTNGWVEIPTALCLGVAAIFVMLACGNVTSVIAPFRTRTVRMGDTSSFNSENGCLRSVISILALGVMLILMLPVIASLTVPIAIGHQPWTVVTLPAAILYGVLLHQSATRMIAPMLQRRAPEILAITVQET